MFEDRSFPHFPGGGAGKVGGKSSTVFNLPSSSLLVPPNALACCIYTKISFSCFFRTFSPFFGYKKIFLFRFVGFVRRRNEGKYKRRKLATTENVFPLFSWFIFRFILFVLWFCGCRSLVLALLALSSLFSVVFALLSQFKLHLFKFRWQVWLAVFYEKNAMTWQATLSCFFILWVNGNKEN